METEKGTSAELVNEKQNSELVTREEMENTPFEIITTRGVSFGAFGQYKITEDYHNAEQVKAELSKLTWNRIIQIMTLVNTMLNRPKN